MLNTLIGAIQDRKEIEFRYSGINRTGQPAAVGVSTSGNVVLRIYQTAGSHVNPNHEWDLCYVSELDDVSVSDITFHFDPPGYKKNDKRMVNIYAQL